MTIATTNVVSHPRFATELVKNPPMKKGPKPRGTASFYAARGKRDRERRLRQRDGERQVEVPGVRPEISNDVAYRLSAALKILDVPKLLRLVEEAERLVREYRAD
jgi:hypothetical protein